MRSFGGFLAVLTLLAIAYAYKISGVLSFNEHGEIKLKSIPYSEMADTLKKPDASVIKTTPDSIKPGVVSLRNY